jgi:hypothetical protein
MSTDVEMATEESCSPNPPTYIPSNNDLVSTIAYFLANKVKAHDLKFQTTKNPKTHFTATYPPQIGIDVYLLHLMRHIRTAPALIIYMLVYIERLIEVLERNYQKQTGTDVPFLMTSFNAHRILLTAFLLAHKYCEDCRYEISTIAKIAGVNPHELKKLEVEYLKFIKFRLYVSEEDFIKYHNAIVLYGREIISSQSVQTSNNNNQRSIKTDQNKA